LFFFNFRLWSRQRPYYWYIQHGFFFVSIFFIYKIRIFHIGEEGFYILCEGSKLKDPSNTCKLFKEVNLAEESDLQFWYFMYGSQIGTLELIVNNNPIWSLTGQQENKWLLAEVTLPPGNNMVFFFN
jgi:hypothetical protein